MADNTELSSGSGGDTLRTEHRTGDTFKTPVTLIDVGGVAAESLVGDTGIGMPCEGMAAEDAAAVGAPVLIAGRYDAADRTLDDGDVGGIAIDASGAVRVSDGGEAITVDNAGTFAVQVDGAALTALQRLDDLQGALKSQDSDELVTRVTDATGTEVNPATEDGNVADILAAVQTIDDPVSGNEMLIAGGATQANDVKVTLDGESVSVAGTVTVDCNGSHVTIDNASLAVTQSGAWSVRSQDGSGTALTSTAVGADQALDVNLVGASVVQVQSNSQNLATEATASAIQTAVETLDDAKATVSATDVLRVAIYDDSDTQITSFGGSGGTAEVDDSAFSAGSDSGTPMMGAAASDAVDVGDFGVVAMDTDRSMHVSLQNAETPNGDSMVDDTNDALNVSIVSGAASGVSHTDDSAFTAGTDDVTPAGALFNDTTPDTVNEGDAGAVRMSDRRELYVQLRDAAGNERGLNVDASGYLTSNINGTVAVDATGQGNVPVTLAGESVAISGTVTVDCNSSNVTIANASLPVTQSGAWSVRAQDGAGTALTSTLVGADQALDVNLVGASTLQVQSNSQNLATEATASAIQTAVETIDDTKATVSATDVLRVAVYDDSDGQVTSFGGGVSEQDDSAFTVGSDNGTPMMGAATSDQVDAGDFGVVAMDTDRSMHVSLQNAETPNGDSMVDDTNDALNVSIVSGASSGVSHTDDSAFTAGTDDVTPAGALFNDTTPDTVNEGDAGAVRMSDRRELYVQLRDAAGNERGLNVDASGYLTSNINGTVAVDATGQGDVPVTLAGESVAVSGTVTVDCNASDVTIANASLPVTQSGAWSVRTQDSSGNTLNAGGGPEGGALRVTLANDSTGLVSVDDNGGSLTVDTTGTSGLEVVQATPDDLNVNANLQQGDVDVAAGNALYVQPGTAATFDVQSNSQNLATESTLSAIQTAVEIMDDWDDGLDRCQVDLAAQSGGNINVSVAADASGGVEVVQDTAADLKCTATLAANDGVDIGNVDVASIAAGTNVIGQAIAASQSDKAYDGTTSCTIKRFNVVATADGNTVISAPTGTKKIRVRSLSVIGISTTGTTIYLQTATTGSDTFGTSGNPIPVGVDANGNNHGGIVLPQNDDGWFETADADEALQVKMPGGAQAMLLVGTYIEVS